MRIVPEMLLDFRSSIPTSGSILERKTESPVHHSFWLQVTNFFKLKRKIEPLVGMPFQEPLQWAYLFSKGLVRDSNSTYRCHQEHRSSFPFTIHNLNIIITLLYLAESLKPESFSGWWRRCFYALIVTLIGIKLHGVYIYDATVRSRNPDIESVYADLC